MKTLYAILALLALLAAGWVTHCAWWVRLLMNDEMDTIGEGVLALLGTIAFPIGCIHGFVLWF